MTGQPHWQIHWQETRKGRVPVFHFDAAHELLGTLLAADVQRNAGRYRHVLALVREGTELSAEIGGNVCTVRVGMARVLVLDTLAPDGIGKACVLETDAFSRVLDAWEEALARGTEKA